MCIYIAKTHSEKEAGKNIVKVLTELPTAKSKIFPGIFRGSSAKCPGFFRGLYAVTHPHSILCFTFKFASVVGKPGSLPHNTPRVHMRL